MTCFRITHLDEVSSTNDEVKQLIAEGAPEGAVVIARRQVGGYGRRGHAWTSPEGGLYMSVLLRPAQHAVREERAAFVAKVPTLSLVVALAVRRGVQRLLPDAVAASVKVKWPNDVLVERPDGSLQKLCGISLEGTPDALCLGIGVNVQPVGDGVAYVQDMADVSIEAVAESVLTALDELYEKWLTHPFVAFLDEYNAANALAGRIVSVRVGDELVEGAFAGADEHGCMQLRQSDGALHTIASGEAHIERIAYNLLETR